MNYLYSTIAYYSLYFFIFGSIVPTNITSPAALPSAAFLMSPAQLTDSLALVALYQSTGGAAWTNRWNLNQPVDTWYGVELDSEGYVTKIQLNNNNLQGTIPNQIGNFSRIQHLQLDNNRLRGSIPSTIGQLQQLSILFLDNNELVGNIPEEIGNIAPLQTLFLDNNMLTGPIPQSFTLLINLWTLDIFNNQIDSLPDLSGINLQRNRFRVYGNQLTFDDIVPNLGRAMGDNYINQDSFFQDTTLNALTGQPFLIDLKIDGTIANNLYQWYKNGIPFGTPLNENKLRFSEIGWGDAGVYHCRVTNPEAPLVTLYSRAITLQIGCGHSYEDLQDTLCSDQQRVIRGIIFDASNPSQDIYLPGEDRYGCDSTLRVNFFIESPAQATLDTTLCPGESLFINGKTYDETNLAGTERFFGGAANGCDSLLTIQLRYSPTTELQITDTLCTGGELSVNGTAYNEANPTGTEVLPGGNQYGCDSTIFIDLTFSNSISNDISPTLCPDDFVIANGSRYDITNPSGAEMLTTQQGCDSLINVNLTFFQTSDTLINETLCENESRLIGGEVFDINRPTGNLILSDRNGCDSIVRVALLFDNVSASALRSTLCFDESLTINGTIYDRAHPNGTETLAGGSDSGCDSIITIELTFRPEPYFLFEPEICEDDIFIYNGRIYDKNNTSDVIILPGRAIGGCDSIVDLRLQITSPGLGILQDTFCANEIVWVGNRRFTQNSSSGTVLLENNNSVCDSFVEVDIHFRPLAINFLNDTLCDSDFLTINGTTYDSDTPSGMELLPGATSSGCDSTIVVNLHFEQSLFGAISDQLCDDEQIQVGSELFDLNRPSGTVTIPGVAPNGCDSVVFVDLSFGKSSTTMIDTTLCPGEYFFINGTLYDENNTKGTEVIPTGNLSGCDSTVFIDLSFHPSSTYFIRKSLCPGGFLNVNGIRYDEFRLGGREVISGGSINGCDSVIDVLISYYNEPLFTLSDTLCVGESITINGTLYDEQNPTGTEVLPTGSINGCDSSVMIALHFHPTPVGIFQDTLCTGGQAIINGTVYDETQTSGTEILENAAQSGCDSMVNIQLTFHEAIETYFTETLCPGESIELLGQLFDENRPQGKIIYVDNVSNGCDSTVYIDLSFYNPVISEQSDTICQGETLSWGGQQLDKSGNYFDTLSLNSINGCDSVRALYLIVVDVFGTLDHPAGDDQDVCPGSTQLAAELPLGMIGRWENYEGLTILDPSAPNTEITGLEDGTYTLYWNISSPQCQITVLDSMALFIGERPVAVDDIFIISPEQREFDFNVLLNDDTEVLPSRQVQLLEQPDIGQLSHLAGGKYRYFKPAGIADTLSFTYQICSDVCEQQCDTALVQLILSVTVEEKEEEIFIPSGITPNGDGVNDAFVIPVLREDPDRYPQNELVVFNRWGQIVFQQDNYQNNWEGTDGSGKALATGTYYYVLRLNVVAGMIFKGDLTIVR